MTTDIIARMKTLYLMQALLLAGMVAPVPAEEPAAQAPAADLMTMNQDARCKQVLVTCLINGAPMRMMLDTGAGILEVFPNAEDRPGQGVLRHLALATDDVDGCIAAVHGEGYEITIEPKDIVIGSVPPLPARIAFCIGPCGEEIEFFNEK